MRRSSVRFRQAARLSPAGSPFQGGPAESFRVGFRLRTFPRERAPQLASWRWVRHHPRVAFEGLEPVTDVSVADWIAPRLRGFGGRVNQVVPDGFAAYARILHPADDEYGEPTTWAEVCRRTGRTAHPLMQWTSIAGDGWLDRETAAGSPQVGEAPRPVLAAILDVLAALHGRGVRLLPRPVGGLGLAASRRLGIPGLHR